MDAGFFRVSYFNSYRVYYQAPAQGYGDVVLVLTIHMRMHFLGGGLSVRNDTAPTIN